MLPYYRNTCPRYIGELDGSPDETCYVYWYTDPWLWEVVNGKRTRTFVTRTMWHAWTPGQGPSLKGSAPGCAVPGGKMSMYHIPAVGYTSKGYRGNPNWAL